MKSLRKTRRPKPRRAQLELLESRRCMSLSVGWDGPGQGSASLLYYIGPAPSSLDQSQVETALKSALDAWASAADITFTPIASPQQLDAIDFTFRNLDGSGRVLAQAYLPDDVNSGRLAGDVQFDSSERWEIGNALGHNAFDLVQVAVHEIGHALGLDHSTNRSSIMYPSATPDQSFRSLPSVDVDAILSLYAAADGVANPPPTTFTPTTPARVTRHFGRGRFGRLENTPDQLFAAASHWQNGANRSDVNGDGIVSPNDALRLLNKLNVGGSRPLENTEGESTDESGFVDCNGDAQLTPLDVLVVVNDLNRATVKTLVDVEDAPLPTDGVVVIPDDDTTTDDTHLNDDSTAAEGSTTDDGADANPTDSDGGTVPDPTDTGTTDTSGTTTDPEAGPGDQETGDQETGDEETGDEETGDEETSDSGTTVDDGATGTGKGTEDEGDDSGTDPGTNDGATCDNGGKHRAHVRLDPISRLDANGDGQLTEDEVPQRLWDHLVKADANEDGIITAEELAALAPGDHPHQPVTDLIERFDANDDSLLTADEVPERVWTKLLDGDTNEDGAISAEELAALMPASLPPHRGGDLMGRGGHQSGPRGGPHFGPR